MPRLYLACVVGLLLLPGGNNEPEHGIVACAWPAGGIAESRLTLDRREFRACDFAEKDHFR